MYLSADIQPAYNRVFKDEGGFQQDPADSANYVNGKLIGTNRGISALAFYDFYKRVPTVQDMRKLTEAQARQIYKAKYWDKIQGDALKNQSVAELIFQYVIGSGVGGGLSSVRKVVNATNGTKIMQETGTPLTGNEAKLINGLNQKTLHHNLIQKRLQVFRDIVAKHPEKQKFLKGWTSRVNRYKFEGETGANNAVLWVGGTLLLIGGIYAYNQQKRGK